MLLQLHLSSLFRGGQHLLYLADKTILDDNMIGYSGGLQQEQGDSPFAGHVGQVWCSCPRSQVLAILSNLLQLYSFLSSNIQEDKNLLPMPSSA